MTKRRWLGVLGMSVVLAGCAAGDPGLAARVGTERLTVAEARDLFAEYSLTPDYEQLRQSDPDGASVTGAATVVGRWVQDRLLQRGARELEVEVTEDEVTEALDAQIEEQLGSRDAFDQLLVEQGLTEEGIRESIRVGLLRQGLAEAITADVEISDEEVQAAYERDFARPSVRAIVSESEEDSQAALDRIEGGEDFAAVAAEVSIDASGQQGGEVGSLVPGAFPPDLEAALTAVEPGEIVGPLQLQDAWVIAELVAPPSLDEIREQILGTLRDQRGATLLDEYSRDLYAADDVVVNPRFGRWDAASGTVVSADPLGQLDPVGGAAQPATTDSFGVPTEAPTG